MEKRRRSYVMYNPCGNIFGTFKLANMFIFKLPIDNTEYKELQVYPTG